MLRVLKVLWRVRVPLATAATLVLVAVWLRCGQISPELLRDDDRPSTVVVDRQGHTLYEARSSGGTRAERIDVDSLPPVLESATIAAEDRRFRSHAGVDPLAWVRAAMHDIAARRIVEGGSTITQQAAKLLIQRREGIARRGLRAKLREMVLALRLEHRFSKREILALYLNLASYGNQTAGVARASRAYFGVSPAMLTTAQAAFLAGLPQRPTTFNPWRNPASARGRQRAILARMAASGAIGAQQLAEARAERLVFSAPAPAFAAPHFVEMALAAAGDRRPPILKTTLDLELQREVEGVIDANRDQLRQHGAANVAVIVLDNDRAEWIAWEGSGNYFDAEHGGAINGPLVPRQPGSALKPFTYALAFEEGRGPSTLLADVPSHFPTAEPGVLYSPRNYDGRYRGPLLARKALAGSENVPAVALASEIGVPKLIRFLTRAGFSTFDRSASYYGLGVTLGNAEVRLDELVAAYSTFARGGVYRAPQFLSSTASSPSIPSAVLSPRAAFFITDILSDDNARAWVFGRGGNLEFPFPVAVKTGTSQAYHDNWTVGYTRDVTVGVWVGNFDRTPLHDSSGVTGAGPLFHAIMLAAERRYRAADRMAGDAILPRPADVTEVTICALSGERANPWCPSRAREWVSAGDDPVPCSWHHQSDEGVITIWPPVFRGWSDRGHAERESGGSHRFGEIRDRQLLPPAPAARAIAIASPPSGALYSIDPTLRPEYQAVPLRATTARPTVVTWAIDGRVVGEVSSERALSWPLAVGRHRVTARDPGGGEATAEITVR